MMLTIVLSQSMSLPDDFDGRGLLPPGDYPVTFEELRRSLLVHGPEDNTIPNWDNEQRLWLTYQAEKLVDQLWKVGITEIYLDGSFLEDKPHPNDIDGYFECDAREIASGALQRHLNNLDVFRIWTWDPKSRRPAKGSTKAQLPMWHKYRVELYPHIVGLLTGIKDEHGHDLPFPAAFRRRRDTHEPKGIVKIISK